MKNKQHGCIKIVASILIALVVITGGIYIYSNQKTHTTSSVTEVKIDTSLNENATSYISAVYTRNGKNYIDIDYITFRHEEGDMPWGTIVNDDTTIRTFEVSDSASIKLSNKEIDGIMTSGRYTIGFSELKTVFDSKNDFRAANPWNVSIKNGVVVEIQENFRS